MENNNELKPTQTPMSTNGDGPDMSTVLKTLRHPSQSHTSGGGISNVTIQSNGQINCPHCNSGLIILQKRRNRDEIIRNLNQLERTLRSRGEQLPQWVQAYKNGNSVEAAKLLHLGYMARTRENGSNKRHVEVVSATSTTPTPVSATTTKIAEGEEDSLFEVGNKRRRISSLE